MGTSETEILKRLLEAGGLHGVDLQKIFPDIDPEKVLRGIGVKFAGEVLEQLALSLESQGAKDWDPALVFHLPESMQTALGRLARERPGLHHGSEMDALADQATESLVGYGLLSEGLGEIDLPREVRQWILENPPTRRAAVYLFNEGLPEEAPPEGLEPLFWVGQD